MAQRALNLGRSVLCSMERADVDTAVDDVIRQTLSIDDFCYCVQSHWKTQINEIFAGLRIEEYSDFVPLSLLLPAKGMR